MAYGRFASRLRIKALELFRYDLLILSGVVEPALVRQICRKRAYNGLILWNSLKFSLSNLFFRHGEISVARISLLFAHIRHICPFSLSKIEIALDAMYFVCLVH